MHNVVLIFADQQMTVRHTYILFHDGYHRILSTVPCALQ